KATVDGTEVIDRTDFVGVACAALSWPLSDSLNAGDSDAGELLPFVAVEFAGTELLGPAPVLCIGYSTAFAIQVRISLRNSSETSVNCTPATRPSLSDHSRRPRPSTRRFSSRLKANFTSCFGRTRLTARKPKPCSDKLSTMPPLPGSTST